MVNFLHRAKAALSPVSAHATEIEVSHGKGCYLVDTKGKAYLDFTSGLGVCSTGHCHPEVVSAIQNQAASLIHGCLGIVYYEPPIALAEKIGQILGGSETNLTSIFFTQSGSEAMETAIKLAKYVTKKHKLVAFRGGFHGRTLGALSVTTSKEKYRAGYEPLLEGVSFFPYPYCYRCPWGRERATCEVYCADHELAPYLEALDNQVAAVIIEPVLGEGGYTFAPKEFIQKLVQKCREKGILVIFDEIQSGIGKTGTWFAFQQLDVAPDIVTIAKGIGSGLPLGACVSTPEIMNQWTKGAHGGTYGGNPVTCAAGLASLKVIEKALPAVAGLGKLVLERLQSELKDHPFVGEIRGQGLMIGIELVTDKVAKTPGVELVKTVLKKCLDQYLIVVSCGIEDNVIRLIPPLTITESELHKGLDILISVIHELH